jgi:outer membrane protein TolC
MMLLAAQQRLEPQLDLGVTLGTNGFNYETSTSRFLTALTSNSTPMNATVRLDWRLPVQNSQALGELQVQQAAFDRSSIQEQDNIRSITINSRLAVERLREAQERLAISRRHVDIATAVLADEELRMKAGTSTLVDLGVMQDDLVSARIGLYTARRDVASAIIQLRFLASMFFRDNGETLSFDETSLYDLSELTR